MTELKHQITINAPKDKVFSVLANLDEVQHYNPGVKAAKYISENKQGVGAARECNLGKEGIVRERITGFKQDDFVAMELYEHSWPIKFMRWTSKVAPAGNATQITQTLEYKMKFGVLGSILNMLILKRKLNQSMSTIFESLKKYVENKP